MTREVDLKKILALMALTVRLYGQTATALTAPPDLQFFDASGRPLAGGLVYTYTAGTNTPRATYSDYTLNSPNPNPQTLNSGGKPATGIWLGPYEYKFVIKTSTGTTIRTIDHVSDVNLVFQALITGANGANSVGYTPNAATGATTVGAFLNAQGFMLDNATYSPATFAGACTAAYGAGKTLQITQVWHVPSGTYNCSMWFTASGKLIFDASSTVTISSKISAPGGQYILDATTNSGVTLSLSPQISVSAGWFGASPSASSSTNATAINAALKYGVNVFLSECGSYQTGASTLSIPVTVKFFDGNVGCAETVTTGNGGWLIGDGYRQTIKIRTRRSSIDWYTGSDTSSVGITVRPLTTFQQSEFHFDFTATGYWTGHLATAVIPSGTDIGVLDGIYDHEEYEDNFIGFKNLPTAGGGAVGFTNNNLHLKFQSRINSDYCPALAGSRLAVFATGSDDNNVFINPEMTLSCAEKIMDVNAINAIIMYGPRFEGCTANTIHFAAATYGSFIRDAYVGGATTLSCFQDQGTNTITTYFGNGAESINNATGQANIFKILRDASGTTVGSVRADGSIYTASTAQINSSRFASPASAGTLTGFGGGAFYPSSASVSQTDGKIQAAGADTGGTMSFPIGSDGNITAFVCMVTNSSGAKATCSVAGTTVTFTSVLANLDVLTYHIGLVH